VPKNKRSKLEATGRKCKFVGYSEDSKAFRIYISDIRKVKISRDVTFDDDVALGKARDLPPPASPEENSDDMDILEGPFVPKSEKDIVDDPMEPMDPLDPPPSDPLARKIHFGSKTYCKMLRDMLLLVEHSGRARSHASTKHML